MNYSNSYKRNIDGVLILDKPEGISSNKILQKIKYIFCAKKAGYSGTLDPIATGMLPIVFGKATKFSHYLLNADKHYLVTAELGKCTNTYDSYGCITNIRDVSLNYEQLKIALNNFRGEISQLPPMFSAIKHQGIPLYKYARKGITVTRKKRIVKIYDLQIKSWNLTYIKLEICCSKGTYIRAIINDLGEMLGCGAHVISLRRLSIGHYLTEYMVKVTDLQNIINTKLQTKKIMEQLDKLLLPIDSIIGNVLLFFCYLIF